MQSCHLVDFQRLVVMAGDLPCGPWVFGRVSSAVSESQDYAAVSGSNVERCCLMLVGGCAYNTNFLIVFESARVRNRPHPRSRIGYGVLINDICC